MFLGISLGVPLILVITLRGQKTLLCVFFGFRDLYGLKLTGDFSRINIFQNMTIRDFGTKQKEPGRGISTRWRATMVFGPPGPPQAHFKTLSRFSWPKNPLYKGLRSISWRRRRIDQKHRNRARISHHRRGTLLHCCPRRDLYPSKIKNLITMMRRE